MKVWWYYRLSRDEDEELNSLTNQRKIIYEYALANGHEIVGESFDDNVSGMHFNCEGINKIYEAVEAGIIEAIIVKDLSRLGRHRTQTALFIDYLREHNVRVLSATESIDTFNENDDLIIGFKGLVNDFYARDGSRRVRTGYRQKQKEGLVAIPPFGYFKDKNTKKVVIVEEAAETVRLIYTEYVGGRGLKAIARILNEQKRKTPAQIRAERCGREFQPTHKNRDGRFLWTYASVKNVLVEEAYTGVLNNHRTETNSGKVKRLASDDWYRHEDFFPVIIEKEEWEQAQQLLKMQARPANGNQAKHRYAGLLTCRECGNVFIPMIRYWNGKRRVEYVCRGYHRNGKSYCTSHRIHEEVLDAAVQSYMENTRKQYAMELKQLAKMQKMWALRKPILDAHILSLQEKTQVLEQEIDEIVMEKIKVMC